MLNGVQTDALWDTEAQVSIISRGLLKRCLPGCDIREMTDLLGMDGLDLKAANGTDLPLVQSLNSPFFPPHIGAEPGGRKKSPG